MVDLAKEAFSTNNFGLAADIYERTIRENGPTSELFLGLADSFARGGQFSKAFNAYTNAYRYGKVTPEKLKHLVVGLIETVKQDLSNSGPHEAKQQSCMFTCGVCRGLLADPVTVPCGHTFCRKCLEKDKSKTCELCSTVHYRMKLRNLSSNVVLTSLIEKLFPSECRAAVLKKEGNGYFEKRDFRNAIDVYSKAIDIAPSDHLLLSNRCHAFASLDMFSEALDDAELVVQLRPDWPKGYFRKGAALYGLGQYEDAAVAFLQCLALDQKVTSAKDYLSKTLDKILSVLPPDDPKAHAMAQQSNPSLLQQLINKNFSKPLLLPDIANTLSDLAQIVKDTICVANNFSQEPKPEVKVGNSSDQSPVTDKKESNGVEEIEGTEGMFSKKLRCSSLPDCSDVDHEEIQKVTLPRSHSPLPSPLCRKRMRNPSSSAQCPLSPTHSSPQKVLKSTSMDTAANTSSASSATAEHTHSKPEPLSVDDLECGLCYRLFYEPVTTPCGHTFCRKCLDRCLDHTVTCPMCKGNLSEYLAERRQAVTDSIQCIIDTYFKKEHVERSKVNDEEMVELAKMGSGQQSDIPVFVCTLSFPTISCPLHIFEPRYRLMVRQCMESGTRQFGMCMHTSDDDNEFSDYGCMLEIRDVQYFPDGRSVVDTIGGRRFKVLSRGHRDGYNTAKVEFMVDKPIDAEELQAVIELQTEVYSLVQNWLARLPSMHRTRITQQVGELPAVEASPASGGNGPAWAWWAVNVLPLDQRVRMALLAMCSYQDRLVALRRVLVYMNRRGSR
ncbi:LON peptidase N-terminal domain and RING finger protein 3 [Aplysia californica]|uniref:LON peptidase N-terminal domain and RING finger protein 3 n=1 Tax=Aplysia californica TaxID=6500 RepID=A0ABM0KAI5_APLCA|nr:LON peptidase N-terminal domain and RING finger protein 3 [Aplysia californica]